jgi:thioredoxin reductase
MMSNNHYDVMIIGGSYAGLSAAMSLGRSLRRVLVIDSGLPCNRQTPHSHNFITQDGETPAAIVQKAKAQVLQYPTVSFVNDLALIGLKINSGFSINTQLGAAYISRKLIFATGIKDQLPDIKGMAAAWGISVIHCPYCHGYEFRGKVTGIMANGERAFHLASLIRNLTDRVTILTNGKADFTAEQLHKLQKYQINIIETEVAEIVHENGYVKHVIFTDGNETYFDAIYAGVPFTQHSDIPVSLGCQLTEQGYLKVDQFFKTTVEGVYACGDNFTMMRSVAGAVYSGNFTGAMVNKMLTDQDF